MPDLSWTASIDVTNVSKALSKIEREANELGVSFDKSFKTADEAIKYFGENISSLETALVRLRKEQADIKLLPQTQERTERLKELKIEVDDVTTSLRQNKKWQQDLSKAQKEDVGNTNTQITSFRSLFRIFQSGTKTSHSLAGGFKAINAVLKANPFGVVVLAAAAVVGVFKKLYNSLQPVKNLVDGISNAFNSLGTSIANALGMETVSQHDAKIKQLEEQKDKLDDLKESVSDLDNEIDKLKEKNKTPKQRLSEIDSQISGYEKDVDAYQKFWDKKSPQWQKNNSSGVLATNLEGAKKQLELAKLQRDEIQKEIDEEDAKAKKAQAEEAERLKKQAEEFDKKRNSYLQALLDDSTNLKYAPRQREINWMEEGHDKVMAQIELDYEKEIDSIKKYESQKIAEYNKLYGKKYATIGELPQSVREPIQGVVSERTQNAESKRDTSTSNYYNGILTQYQDFETQRKNIRDKYANDAEQLRKKDTEESKAALAELERAYKKELEANSVEQRNYIKANGVVLKKAFGNTAIKTKKELEEVITILESYKAVLGAENEADALNIGEKLGFTDEETNKIWANGDKIQEEIEAVTEDIDNLKQSRTGLKKIADDFKNLAKSAKAGGLDFTEQLGNVLGYVNGVTSAVDSIAQKMHEIAAITGDDTLEKKATAIQRVTENINAAGSGAATGASIGGGYGAIIGAVLGGGINIISQIADANAQNKAAGAELKQQYSDIAFEIHRIVTEQENWIESNNLFGSSVKTNIEDAKRSYENYTNQANESLAKLNSANTDYLYSLYSDEKKKRDKFVEVNLFGWQLNKKTGDRLQSETDKYQNEYLDSQSRTGLKDIIGNLRTKGGSHLSSRDGYENLFIETENGFKLDTEVARTFIDVFDDNTVSDFFKQVIEETEKANEAEKNFEESVSSMVGSFANDIASNLIDAFQSGEDAGKKMFDTIGGYTKNWVQELIKADLLETVFTEDKQKELIEIMKNGTAEEFDTAVSDIVTSAGNLTDKYKDKLNVLEKYDTGSLSSSTAKGIAQASQDSVDELNGRFTAIQSHTYSINENMKEMQTRQAVILTEIMGIHTDTSSLKTMLINGTARVKIN